MIIACNVAEAIGILSFHVKLLLRSCCSETSSDTSSRPGGTHYAAAVQRLFALLISPGSKLLCYSVACVFFRPQINLRSCCRQSLSTTASGAVPALTAGPCRWRLAAYSRDYEGNAQPSWLTET